MREINNTTLNEEWKTATAEGVADEHLLDEALADVVRWHLAAGVSLPVVYAGYLAKEVAGQRHLVTKGLMTVDPVDPEPPMPYVHFDVVDGAGLTWRIHHPEGDLPSAQLEGIDWDSIAERALQECDAVGSED